MLWRATIRGHSGTCNISGWPYISNKYNRKYRTKFDSSSTLCLWKGWLGSTKPHLSLVYLEQIPFNFFPVWSLTPTNIQTLWVCIFLLDLKRFCHYSAYVFLDQLTILPFSCGLTIFKPTFLAREVLRRCSIWLSFIPKWCHEAALESFTFTSHSAMESS